MCHGLFFGLVLSLFLLGWVVEGDAGFKRPFKYSRRLRGSASGARKDFSRWRGFNRHKSFCNDCVDEQQRNELPILDNQHYDPSLIGICNDPLAPDEVYTGLLTVLVAVENALRNRKCGRGIFNLHHEPVKAYSLYGSLPKFDMKKLMKEPITGTYVETFSARSREFIRAANDCRFDYRLLMKLVRLAMKEMMNKLSCCQLKRDISQGYGKKRGSQLVPYPSPHSPARAGSPLGRRSRKNPYALGKVPNTDGRLPHYDLSGYNWPDAYPPRNNLGPGYEPRYIHYYDRAGPFGRNGRGGRGGPLYGKYRNFPYGKYGGPAGRRSGMPIGGGPSPCPDCDKNRDVAPDANRY